MSNIDTKGTILMKNSKLKYTVTKDGCVTVIQPE